MTDPLNPVVEGDLGAFGIADRNPISVETPEPVEEAQATAAETVEEVEEAPEVQAEPEPAEGEEKSGLELLIEQEVAPVEESSVEVRMREIELENARLKAGIEAREQERLRQEEARVRALATPKPTEQAPADYLNNPAVQAVLRQVRDEQPEQYEQTLIDLATQQMDKKLEEKERLMTERLQTMERERQEQERNAQVKQVIESTLSEIGAEGGLYADLIADWNSRRMDSFVGKKMMETPQMFWSAEGVRDAVQSLESRLRHQLEMKKAGPSTGTGVVASAGTGVASTRGVEMNEKPKETTPEDEYSDRMFNSSRNEKIEFLG